MKHFLLLCSGLVAACAAAGERAKTVRYLRPAGQQFQTECTFTEKHAKTGSVIESVTERGKIRLTITSRYDDKHVLTFAEAVLRGPDETKTATVKGTAGKVTIERAGKTPEEFEAPPGVIVTSAPDWTDTFLLCRRYDRKTAGKQTFAGLWIHPTEPCRRLSFAIERHGQAMIDHAGVQVTLDRFTIWLRNNNAYAAWTYADGKMIKLVPLPFKASAANWLVLDGYEKSVSGLRP